MTKWEEFDVVSLFTYMPLRLMCETIVTVLDEFDLDLPHTVTIEMLEHCLLNFFQFGNCYYQQVKDTPMGSRYLGSLPKLLLLLLFVIIKEDRVSAFHHLFSTSLPGIGFTMEEPTNYLLPFLT